MKFAEIAASLGIETYPEGMDAVYEEVKAGAAPLFDRALIDRHHEERELFGQYYPDVVRGYEDLCTRENAYLYAQVAARYMPTVGQSAATAIPLPEPDGTPALDMLPLMIELPMADRGIREFIRRGYTPEEAEKAMVSVFRGDIAVNVRRHGRPGLDKTYFNWITLFLYAVIFPCCGFRMNLSTAGRFFYVLKHKESGEVAVLLHDRDIHRSGEILGSAGLTDEEGSFHVTFTETETEYTGYPTDKQGLIANCLTHYPKDQWELAVKPGDNMIALHLPAGMKLSREITRQAVREAFRHAEKYYPDYAPKAIHCGSWILNPQLAEPLGENSNIMAFASVFHLHPTKCAGKSVFNFVFKSSVNPDLATLPEDTRLQRWLKAKYLAGGYHRNFGGFILPHEVD
ncbi:MAG: hypothetical protein IKU07_02075 [Oscillospiraceae bacterium]|nr:hypothetical protein [Oscillospiraceae bacterium]